MFVLAVSTLARVMFGASGVERRHTHTLQGLILTHGCVCNIVSLQHSEGNALTRMRYHGYF